MVDRIIAIDPGTTQSAMVVWDGKTILNKELLENDLIRRLLNAIGTSNLVQVHLVIEQVAAMGMAVGAEVFETVYWTGIFAESFGLHLTSRIKRHVVKMHLCGNMRAKDSNIRQALIDRFGAPGTKKAPGLTYGLKKDLWAAFALGVTWWDIENEKAPKGTP